MSEIKRINCTGVTDCLMRAMEAADEMKMVMVVYETKEGADHVGGFFVPEETTVEKMNWLIDLAKKWLFR